MGLLSGRNGLIRSGKLLKGRIGSFRQMQGGPGRKGAEKVQQKLRRIKGEIVCQYREGHGHESAPRGWHDKLRGLQETVGVREKSPKSSDMGANARGLE